MFVHPDFDVRTLEFDAALLRLQSPLVLRGPHVRPICLQLPRQNTSDSRNAKSRTNGLWTPLDGALCTVTGFGATAEFDSTLILIVKFARHSTSECEQKSSSSVDED